MKHILLAFLLALSTLTLRAQTHDHHEHNGKICAFEHVNDKFLDMGQNRVLYEQRKQIYAKAAQQWQQSQLNRGINAVRRITIVFHVIYNPASATDVYVSDAEIQEIIDILNQDYTRTNPDVGNTRAIFTGVASGVNLNFCLAQTDPNGNVTTGIVRVDTNEDFFDSNTETDEMKLAAGVPVPGTWPASAGTTGNGDPAWDPTQYMNVWICNITNGAGGGTAGYAYLPGAAGQGFDGLVLDSDIGIGLYGGFPNRTATHEIGHYLGMQHIWADMLDCTGDDGMADIPTSASDNMDVADCTPSPAPNTCNDGAGDLPDQFENYMSYASCQNMFSADQAAYMNGVIDADRPGVVDNGLCNPPELTANFTPATQTIINAGQSVTFVDASSGPSPITSYSWSFESGSVTTQNTVGPHTITYNTPGTFQVSLTVGDGTSTDSEVKTAHVVVNDVLNANFDADITYVPINDNVTFTDHSSGPLAITSRTWDFGDSGTSTATNPVHAYSAVGLYTVKLTVGDGANTDIETKTDYIEVYDPALLHITDFVGVPTTVNAGANVRFTITLDQPISEVDSIRWFFPGSAMPTALKYTLASFNVNYPTGGIYPVEARAYRNMATDGDTLIKTNYITVLSPDSVPVANFTATNTNIAVGTTIDFINLTTPDLNRIDSMLWEIETSPGVYTYSTAVNPTGITYSVAGDFNVRLYVWGVFGDHDTLKYGYIHVYDPASLNPIQANFEAITVRLITMGESVRFEDLSEGDVQNWTYIFDRGAGSAQLEYEYTQNPVHTFMTAGYYKVSLIAANTTYADTLDKNMYVVVTTTPWPNAGGYCDTLDNYLDDEIVPTYRRAQYPNLGIFPGHYTKVVGTSKKYVKRYAERFTTYTPDVVRAVLVPIVRAHSGTSNYFNVMLWNASPQGHPYELLTSNTTSENKVIISSLEERMYNYIELDEAVEVDSVFFVGLKLKYDNTSQDTIGIYMAPERANAEDNTLFISDKDAATNYEWYTPTEFLGFTLNTSLGLKVLGCVVDVPEVKDLEANLIVYPNPAQDKLYIELGAIENNQVDIQVYDIVGKSISSSFTKEEHHIEVDLNACNNGFYMVKISIGESTVTRKILIQK